VDIAAAIQPSQRGEIESPTSTAPYLERGDLYVQGHGPWLAWLDTGTHASLVEASHFVQILEQRQGLRIGVSRRNCAAAGLYFARPLLQDCAEDRKEQLWRVPVVDPQIIRVDAVGTRFLRMNFKGSTIFCNRRRRVYSDPP